MPQATSKKTRSGKHKGKSADKSKEEKGATSSGSGILVTSVVVVVVAIFWGAWQGGKFLFFSGSGSEDVDVDSLTPLDRLLHYWPSGGAVSVQSVSGNNTDDNRGLVAAKKIRKGSVAVASDYQDLQGEITSQRPELPAVVESVLGAVIKEQSAKFATLTAAKVLALIRFLQLVDIEEDPKWTAYADTLPQNVTNIAWYWTPEERKCIVPRPDDEAAFQNVAVFRQVMAQLAEQDPLVHQINPQRAEWAYGMMTTRGFGELFFIPVLDMANHDPLRAAPTFFLREQAKIYLVAPHTIQEGHPVYLNYGPLTPVQSAEIYGFVQSEPTYFEIPSIHRDLWLSDLTSNIEQCTKNSVRFFGNVGDQVISANLGKGENAYKYSMHFKAFMPSQLAHACLRVLIQSDEDSDMARYVAQKLQADYDKYASMANAPHCKSVQGNFPLIQQANEATANLIWDAYELADKAAKDGNVSYPGIPSYVQQKPPPG